ncbi:hypothetical protein ABU614_00470 [Lysobacter firmicutimachus]|uniref:Uncharacterized protein n=1 Tax=Lysobacter firmicutimachus TaxID=1792846 RepID=A0AAU8MTI0_9GAMM
MDIARSPFLIAERLATGETACADDRRIGRSDRYDASALPRPIAVAIRVRSGVTAIPDRICADLQEEIRNTAIVQKTQGGLFV